MHANSKRCFAAGVGIGALTVLFTAGLFQVTNERVGIDEEALQDRGYHHRSSEDKQTKIATGLQSTTQLDDSDSIASTTNLPNFRRTSKPNLLARRLSRCRAAREHFFYLGIHRTGSSTLRIVFQLFAKRRGLNLCMDSITKWRSAWPFDFMNGLVMSPHGGKCDVLAEFMVYNANELQRLAHPDTVLITSVADPINHFISMFISNQLLGVTRELSGMAANMSLVEGMAYFLRDPALVARYFATWPDKRKGNQFQALLQRRNLQLYDLGMQERAHITQDDINDRLGEFHVVLIQDYFDESLVLLKHKMCWSNTDILYSPVKKIRDGPARLKHRQMADKLHGRILSYNDKDAMLHGTANRTFWKEIAAIPNFKQQLEEFKRELTEFQRMCGKVPRPTASDSKCFPPNENTFWRNLQFQVRDKYHKLALSRFHNLK